MRRSAAYFFVVFAGLVLGQSTVNAQPQTAQCRGIRFLWTHVYNPQRLEVRKLCAAVTGVIVTSLREKGLFWFEETARVREPANRCSDSFRRF